MNMKKTILSAGVAALLLASPVLAEDTTITTNSIAQVQSKIDQAKIKSIFQNANLKARTSTKKIAEVYTEFYKAHPDQFTIWIQDGAFTPAAENVITVLENSAKKGLVPKNYHIDAIKSAQGNAADVLLTEAVLSYMRDLSVGQPELIKADKEWLLPRDEFSPETLLVPNLESEKLSQLLQDIEPKHVQYQRIQKALGDVLEKSQLLEKEELFPEGAKLAKGDQGERVKKLRQRLAYLNYPAESGKNELVFDQNLKEAVMAFQKDHLLEPDGVVGARTQKELNLTNKDRVYQLMTNLERWRWMPKDMGSHYLVVDIPGFEYYVMKEGKETMRAKTVVGMAQRSTPVFMASMNHIVFAPYWHVPRSMAVKDKLPQLKRDPERLARSKIRIFDRDGNEIDPTMVDWSQYNTNNFPYRLRQDPGSYNALGKVKFMFPNKHAIYLHDTPQKSLFSKTERTFSSGCIRIENPIELAEYFLKDQDWKVDKIKSAYNGNSEKTIRLKEEMRFPVYTLYMTVNVGDDGAVQYRSDIYSRDGLMRKIFEQMEK